MLHTFETLSLVLVAILCDFTASTVELSFFKEAKIGLLPFLLADVPKAMEKTVLPEAIYVASMVIVSAFVIEHTSLCGEEAIVGPSLTSEEEESIFHHAILPVSLEVNIILPLYESPAMLFIILPLTSVYIAVLQLIHGHAFNPLYQAPVVNLDHIGLP